MFLRTILNINGMTLL